MASVFESKQELLAKLEREGLQFLEESRRHEDERDRLNKEVERLQQQLQTTTDGKKRKQLQDDISLTKAKKELANSKAGKANALSVQRLNEWRKVRGVAGAEGNIQRFKKAAEEREDTVKKNQEAVSNIQKKREQYEGRQSKKLLSDALKEGFTEVLIIVLVILGQPGVGKSHTKYLVLDRRPPHIRNSTIGAETPVRIEIRTASGSRAQNIRGRWKEVNDKEMLDIVARMIIEAEPQLSLKADKGLLAKLAKLLQLDSRGAAGARLPKLDPVQKPKAQKATKSGDTAPLLSETCREAMEGIMEKLVERISKLRDSTGQEEGSAESLSDLVLKSKWVYFTDSGGQPEFHELLPLFVRNISSALCVTRLTDKLDEIQEVEYYRKGKKVGDSQHSQLTTKDTIQCLVNTLHSYSDQEKPPKVLIVGTHVDKLDEAIEKSQCSSQQADGGSVETIEEKNKQLLDMLIPEFKGQLVYSSNDMKQVIFPVNTLNPGKKDKAIAQSIRSHVEASAATSIKIPIWWHILQLLLQELAKALGRWVLSRAECLEMARLLDIKEESFEAALEFFDELNVIKYNRAILPDVVFVESQIPLEKLSELIQHRYLLSQPISAEGSLPVDGDWSHFRDQGIVSKDCLKHFKEHYVPGIFSVDDLCTLMKKRLVFAPVPNPHLSEKEALKEIEEGKETHYVMPSLQRTLSEAQLSRFRDPSRDIATLLVCFPNKSRRAGVYCCFVVHLIKHCGWTLLLDQNEPLYRNCLQLRLLTTPPCKVTLLDCNTYIEVIVKITDDTPSSECVTLLNVIKEAILAGIGSACSALNFTMTRPEFSFYCPCADSLSSASDSQHRVLEQHRATLNNKKTHLCCDVIRDKSYRLQPKHLVWLGISTASEMKRSSSDVKESPANLPFDISTPRHLSATGQDPPAKLSSASYLPEIPEYHYVSTSTRVTESSSSNSLVAKPRPLPAVSQETATDQASAAESLLGTTTQPTAVHHSSKSTSLAAESQVGAAEQPTIVKKSSKTSSLEFPTSKSMVFIQWRNEQGETETFRIKEQICSKWHDLGCLLDVPLSVLSSWEKKHLKDDLSCINEVLRKWLEEPNDSYPNTWEGLYRLLNHANLGQVAEDLKRALANAL